MDIKDTKERNEKTLSDVFRDLQEIRNSSSSKNNNVNVKFLKNKVHNINSQIFNTKKKSISIVGIAFFIIFIIVIMSCTNNIFASNTNDSEIEPNFNVESNFESIEIEEIISDNISTVEKKELATEDREIDFKTTYIENENMPKDEQTIKQKGIKGNKIVTVLKTYETVQGYDAFKEEKILNTTVTQNPVEQIIEVGTSELLGKFKVHLGETLYTSTNVQLKENPQEDANDVYIIGKYLDVKVIGVEGNYIKAEYLDLTGYIDSNLLVSEYTNPEYVEKCRLQKLLNKINFEMDVSKPSGLTLEEFKMIFANNPRDVNKIFENNAEAFYNVETKYNINGLLVAAIGIHESAWGTSAIARDKLNLFGYGAYDGDAYNSAFTFASYEEGIETVAKSLTKNYLNTAGTIIYGGETATGKYYNGTTISAINVRYATDDNWGNAVYNIMEGLYEKLQ